MHTHCFQHSQVHVYTYTLQQINMTYDKSHVHCSNNISTMYNYGINEALTFNQISRCMLLYYRVYIVLYIHVHYIAYDIISDNTPT